MCGLQPTIRIPTTTTHVDAPSCDAARNQMGTMAQVRLKNAACSGARTTKLPENSLTAAVSRTEDGRRTRWRTLDVGRARFTCVHTRHLSWIRITSRMCGCEVHSLQYVEESQRQQLWARKDLSVRANAAGLFGGRRMCTYTPVEVQGTHRAKEWQVLDRSQARMGACASHATCIRTAVRVALSTSCRMMSRDVTSPRWKSTVRCCRVQLLATHSRVYSGMIWPWMYVPRGTVGSVTTVAAQPVMDRAVTCSRPVLMASDHPTMEYCSTRRSEVCTASGPAGITCAGSVWGGGGHGHREMVHSNRRA